MDSTDVRVLVTDEKRKLILLVLDRGGLVELSDGRSFEKPSKWGLAGGRNEPEDKDEVDTALREFKEETGISVFIDERLRVESKAYGHTKVVFVGYLTDKKEAIKIKINPAEILKCQWFPIGVLYDANFNIYSHQKQMVLELLQKLRR